MTASITILNYLLGKILLSATSKSTLVAFGLLGESGVCQEGNC